MKNTLVLSVSIFIGVISGTGQAQAFYFQDSLEFASPGHSPYPFVLSYPLEALPQGFITISVGPETYYYCNGIFYQKIMRVQKYAVVPPPIGAVVFTIPEGYQLMLIDGITYYEYEGVYYKQVLEGYKVVFPPV